MECTETFYKQNVLEEIGSQHVDDNQKEKMLEMLRRFEQEGDEMAREELLSSDDEKEDFVARFKDINIESTDFKTIWNKLTPHERDEFKSKISNTNPDNLLELTKELPLWKPWWEDLTTSKSQKIIELDGSNDKDSKSSSEVRSVKDTNRPLILKDIGRLEDLTNKSPNPNLAFNLVNILYPKYHPNYVYAYAYACRIFNGDIYENPEESILVIWSLSPILSINESLMYESVSQALAISNSIILQNPSYTQPPEFLHLILSDIIHLLTSLDNVLASLSDLYNLFHQPSINKTFASSSPTSKSYKRKIFLTQKKIYFYLAYTNSLRRTDEEKNELGILEFMKKGLEFEKEKRISEFEEYQKNKESVEEVICGGKVGKDRKKLNFCEGGDLITEI
ncbi:13644_t:CDS:2 [Acaulospora morrowiae]|uniref:13644_t:CDS:1 n=1 Tax=Acaulospora morrowiae TaxID=94023 RepID=A0A9N9A610_9GLOM|nr:13644_t:CDS:2 [Acaulospora morrowiae]